MAKIVEPPKPKRATCNECRCVVEYMPEEVKTASYSCMGESSGHSYVKCPRKGCPGSCVIRGTEW